MELLSKDTKLQVCATSSGDFQTLYGLQTTPDVGGSQEKVEITNLKDGRRRYINGLKSGVDALKFDFYYNDSTTNANVGTDLAAVYSTLRGYDTAGTNIYYKLIFPDGSGFEWYGSCCVTRKSAEVNKPLAFSVESVPIGDITDIAATGNAGD